VHLSVEVQMFPSLQTLRFGSVAVQVSLLSLQLSEQSESLSPTFMAHGSPVAMLLPPEQLSVPVQNRPSLHELPSSFVITQPVVAFAPGAAGLHTSSVQALPSLQFAFTCVKEQAPVVTAQASVVHDFESLHEETLQQKPPTQAPAAPLVSAHSAATVHGWPGAFLYVSARVGPLAVAVSRE
jgi:hypothetical protein